MNAAGSPMLGEQQRKANLRLALILVSMVLVFGLGFVAKVVVFGF